MRLREHMRIELPRLTRIESIEMIHTLSRQYGLDLDEKTVLWLSKVYRGYPLMIVEGMKRRQIKMKERKSRYCE